MADDDLLLFTCTYGADAPERATVPFIAAGAAVAAGKGAAVVCTAEAVWLGTEGGAGEVAAEGMPPLRDLYEAVVGGGGQVWLCSACTSRRGITEDQLAAGARIVGAVQIVEALSGGGKAISLT